MKRSPEELLAAARASGVDDPDLGIAAVLRDHPELAGDFDANRQADQLAIKAMAETEIPAGLEEQLIGILRQTRRAARQSEPAPVVPGIVSFPQRRSTRRNWLAGAAAVALGAAGGGWFLAYRRRPSFDDMLTTLARISREGVTLSLMSMDRDEVAAWLTSREAPRAGTIPGGLDALPRKGCHIYQIDGRKVSLECFLLPEMRELHVFTTPAADFRNLPPEGAEPVFKTIDGLTAALWQRDAKVIALVTDQPAEAVRPVLQGA